MHISSQIASIVVLAMSRHEAHEHFLLTRVFMTGAPGLQMQFQMKASEDPNLAGMAARIQ